jgi:transposase
MDTEKEEESRREFREFARIKKGEVPPIQWTHRRSSRKVLTMNNYKKRYTKEFKEAAVRLMVTSDKSAKELARELGVSDVSLFQWKKEAFRNGDHPEQAKPNGIQIDRSILEQENIRLKKENESLRQQREILKKSLGILSVDPSQGGMP